MSTSGNPAATGNSVEVFGGPVLERRRPRLTSSLLRFAVKQPLGMLGLVILVVLIAVAVFAPLIAPYAPDAFHADAVLAAPSGSHPFGTDPLGQDMFSRIIYGSRIALSVSGGAVLLGVTGGIILGTIAGYWSNLASTAVQRLVDAMMAFPTLIVALIVVAVLGTGLGIATLAIAISMIPSSTRVVRSAVLGVKVEPYLEAAHVLGASSLRTILRHVLPNIMPTVIVAATVSLGGAILAESALSFLGLGAPPTDPSWGQMLSSQARRYMQSSPWLAIFPGLAVSLVVMAVNLLGDALRDVLDPRMRGS